MIDPLQALLWFVATVAVAVLVLWPRRGVLAVVRRRLGTTERVLLEDALKHVHTCETGGRSCSLQSLAGQLAVSTDRAAELMSRLSASGLASIGERGLELTEEGRTVAVHLVRSHRLWERYLADRTAVPAGEWHEQAEEMEHALSPDDADRLASRLGHPQWDPHGDPIPTAGGLVPSVEGDTLDRAEVGAVLEIVHLEDEPRALYDALRADGFELGVRLRVVDRSDSELRVEVSGVERVVLALAAHNVTVRRLADEDLTDAPFMTLVDLAPGATATVAALSPACQGVQRRRLLDLGIVRGTAVEYAFASAAGDPVAYRVRGALLALRRQQAAWIRIDADRDGPTDPDPASHRDQGVA